jgi:hypothetical protein
MAEGRLPGSRVLGIDGMRGTRRWGQFVTHDEAMPARPFAYTAAIFAPSFLMTH